MKRLILSLLVALGTVLPTFAADNGSVTYKGEQGPGLGKKLVFLAGDEEYRSEEALPQLAKILATHHGFECTVLFSVDDNSGSINPGNRHSLTNPEAIDRADGIVMLLRFREWPESTMERFVKKFESGVPIVALRTSTHAFNYSKNDSPYAKFSWGSSKEGWKGGFGKVVLGETWVAHHGAHKKEGTRGIIDPQAAGLPIMRGVKDIFGDTDVYTAAPPADATILVRGEVTETLDPASPAVKGSKNNPMQPVAWTRLYKQENGVENRIFTTTMGSATDLKNEGLRRLLINAVYWGQKMEDKISASANVDLVGTYEPTMYGFGSHKKEIKPSDLQ